MRASREVAPAARHSAGFLARCGAAWPEAPKGSRRRPARGMPRLLLLVCLVSRALQRPAGAWGRRPRRDPQGSKINYRARCLPGVQASGAARARPWGAPPSEATRGGRTGPGARDLCRPTGGGELYGGALTEAQQQAHGAGGGKQRGSEATQKKRKNDQRNGQERGTEHANR